MKAIQVSIPSEIAKTFNLAPCVSYEEKITITLSKKEVEKLDAYIAALVKSRPLTFGITHAQLIKCMALTTIDSQLKPKVHS